MIINNSENYNRPELVIWNPYLHNQITITKNGQEHACLIGNYWCKYHSGPSLLYVADFCGELFGPGHYGIKSTNLLGYWWDFINSQPPGAMKGEKNGYTDYK